MKSLCNESKQNSFHVLGWQGRLEGYYPNLDKIQDHTKERTLQWFYLTVTNQQYFKFLQTSFAIVAAPSFLLTHLQSRENALRDKRTRVDIDPWQIGARNQQPLFTELCCSESLPTLPAETGTLHACARKCWNNDSNLTPKQKCHRRLSVEIHPFPFYPDEDARCDKRSHLQGNMPSVCNLLAVVAQLLTPGKAGIRSKWITFHMTNWGWLRYTFTFKGLLLYFLKIHSSEVSASHSPLLHSILWSTAEKKELFYSKISLEFRSE